MIGKLRIDIQPDVIGDFCRRWRIVELSLFGSVLRADFGPDSDIDVLVSFDPAAEWRYFHLLDMKDELESFLGHSVDIVEKRLIEGSGNYIRRDHILTNRETVYVA